MFYACIYSSNYFGGMIIVPIQGLQPLQLFQISLGFCYLADHQTHFSINGHQFMMTEKNKSLWSLKYFQNGFVPNAYQIPNICIIFVTPFVI